VPESSSSSASKSWPALREQDSGEPRSLSSTSRNMKRLLLAPVQLCVLMSRLTCPELAPEATKPLTLQPSAETRETYRDTILVANSSVFRGYMRGDLKHTVDPTHFVTWIPHLARAARLCATISSQDGRYYGQYVYDIGTPSDASYFAALRQTYRPALRLYRGLTLAILAAVGDSCTDPGRVYVPASWAGESPSTMSLLINNEGADSSMFWPTTRAFSSCVDTDSEPRTAYTSLCSLLVPLGAGQTTVTLVRFVYNSRVPDLSLRLYVP
jgi:hypothetical protein